jgi:geranylgeranyl pyrophosphate synthase
VLEIFRRKTAPAFEVALRLGAVLGGADEDTQQVLRQYSENLGIAYQVRDDMEDWLESEGTSDAAAMRPTLLPAIAHDKARGEAKETIATLWRREAGEAELAQIKEQLAEQGADERARELLDAYKEEAVRSLRTLETPTLKGLLRRVMGKIFNDVEIKGWCSEFETADASGGATGAEPAA